MIDYNNTDINRELLPHNIIPKMMAYNNTDINRVLLPPNVFRKDIRSLYEKYNHIITIEDKVSLNRIQIVGYKIIKPLSNNSNLSDINMYYNKAKSTMNNAIKNVKLLIDTYEKAVKNLGSTKQQKILSELEKINEELKYNDVDKLIKKIISIENEIENINSTILSLDRLTPEVWRNICKEMGIYE